MKAAAAVTQGVPKVGLAPAAPAKDATPAELAKGATPAELAKGAFRRLAQTKQEPTPANFARAYAEESGEPARALGDQADAGAAAQTWAALIDKLARGLDRGSRQWTVARKKQSLQRVLDGSRSDAVRLQQRLSQLVAAWDDGSDEAGAESVVVVVAAAPAADLTASTPAGDAQPLIIDALGRGLRAGLPPDDPRAALLADELSALAGRIHSEGATPDVAQGVAEVCVRAQRLFEHRHHLVDELLQLCRSLSAGLTELAEDGSWAQGQSDNLRARLDDSASVRAVRAARDMLEQTRRQQHDLRSERDRSRDALKAMVRQMLAELADVGQVTGRFNEQLERYAGAIEQADTLDSLAGLVGEMVSETRAVHGVVAGARERMAAEHARAGELESRVRALEGELRRLSDEVSTDALTQVANRRGMAAAFEVERARVERDGSTLAIGLIDIDNFKRLNDSLGHAVGDVALKALAARVRDALRPVDHVARFGGEEFVVLLPATAVDEAQQVLTRLQRELTASLFMHEGREVFVTFSAGVTAYQSGEALELALERADEGLYEAKRSGKNRTCVR